MEKKIMEIDVLADVLAETKRFEKRINELIEKIRLTSHIYMPYNGAQRAAVKRAAMDLRKELARITTATGGFGTYFYK